MRVGMILGSLLALAGTALAGGDDAGQEDPIPVPPDEIRPFLVSLENDGRLLDQGDYATPASAVARIFEEFLPGALEDSEGPRGLVLYAHGGMVHRLSGIRRAPFFQQVFLPRGLYPVTFAWATSIQETLGNVAQDAWGSAEREAGAGTEWDITDAILEPIIRHLGGKLIWGEIKENAARATLSPQGGARFVAQEIALAKQADPDLELHMAGHSAGSILLGHLAKYLTDTPEAGGLGLSLDSVTLWAPAISIAAAKQTWFPALRAGRIGRMTIYNLHDENERGDNVAGAYRKSVLYLVQNALEDERYEPNLGITQSLLADAEVKALVDEGLLELVLTPNQLPLGHPDASRANRHTNFEQEDVTVTATAERIVQTRARRRALQQSQATARATAHLATALAGGGPFVWSEPGLSLEAVP